MFEVPDAGKDHREATVIGSFDHVGVADRTAGLDRRPTTRKPPLTIISFLTKLSIVKANPKIKATKPRPAGNSSNARLRGGKSKQQGGFAPELCGIITGPTDLSLREGFGRG